MPLTVQSQKDAKRYLRKFDHSYENPQQTRSNPYSTGLLLDRRLDLEI